MPTQGPRKLAQLAAEALWIGVLGALFAGWLMTANSDPVRAWRRGFVSECVSFGKGGGHCAGGAAGSAEDQAGAAGDCSALGKAGRVCFAHAATGKAAN